MVDEYQVERRSVSGLLYTGGSLLALTTLAAAGVYSNEVDDFARRLVPMSALVLDAFGGGVLGSVAMWRNSEGEGYKQRMNRTVAGALGGATLGTVGGLTLITLGEEYLPFF